MCFFFGLQLSETILCFTDNLSKKTLQKQSLPATEGQHLAELTILTLKGMRSEDLLLEFVNKMSEHTRVEDP